MIAATMPASAAPTGINGDDRPEMKQRCWRNVRAAGPCARWKSARSPESRAARAVPDRLLLRRLSGPGQCRLRGADDEQGPRPLGDRFGFGAGIFFLTYFIFEVPSNLFLERFGARKWIARIMLSWGMLSGAMAFDRDRRDDLLPRSRAARRCRGRLLSRHHLLPDPLVPGASIARASSATSWPRSRSPR